jgi:phosphoribosylformylglycinamidine (FGAM) synthase-like enzyme
VLAKAIEKEIVVSAHGIYRGGLGIHLAMVAMAGGLGMDADLSALLTQGIDRSDMALFSESAGRFIVTIAPEDKDTFEKMFHNLPFACIGNITDSPDINIKGIDGKKILSMRVSDLKSAWQKPFGDLI